MTLPRNVLRVTTAALVAAFVSVMGAQVATADPVPPVLPGSKVHVVHADATASTCTVGPYVSYRSPAGEKLYAAITAGHCGDNGDAVYRVRGDGSREHISNIFGAVNDRTSNDYALLPLNTSYVNPKAGVPYTPQGIILVQELAAASVQGVPVSLCSYGVSTGDRCGPLVEVVGGRIHAKFPSSHGDSGGPVWANTANGEEVVGILRGNLIADPSVSVIIPIGVPLTAYTASLVVVAS